MMSGTTFQCSAANHFPVRPKPVITSSRTRTIPYLSQSARRPWRNPSGGTRRPDVPTIGSRRIAATYCGPSYQMTSWTWASAFCASSPKTARYRSGLRKCCNPARPGSVDERRNISLRRPVDEDVLLRIGEDLGDVGAIRGERHRSSDYTLGGD